MGYGIYGLWDIRAMGYGIYGLWDIWAMGYGTQAAFRDVEGGIWGRRDLRGNPFVCDCRLRWLVAWLGSAVPNTDAGRCRGPQNHAGTPIGQLQLRDFQCRRDGERPQWNP